MVLRCYVRDTQENKGGLHPSRLKNKLRRDGVRRRHVTTQRPDRRTLATVMVVAQLFDGRQRNGTRWSTDDCVYESHTRGRCEFPRDVFLRGAKSMKDDERARARPDACVRVCTRRERGRTQAQPAASSSSTVVVLLSTRYLNSISRTSLSLSLSLSFSRVRALSFSL